jgi:addiction module RelE/StbE family toxin
MTVLFSRRFKKQYKKLSPQLQRQTKARIELWKKHPADPTLNKHRLKGKLSHLYSINITGDVRALYEIIDDEIYLYQMVGTHSQLYE